MQTLEKTQLETRQRPFAPESPPHTNVKISLWRTTLCAGLVCCLAPATLSAAPVSYGFDSLNNGALVGQNGWYADSAQSPVTSTAAATGTGLNTTRIITSGASYSDRAIRNFGAPFYSGTETKALLQFDYRVGSEWTMGQFALGGSSDVNLVLNGNNTAAFSPRISLTRNDAGTGIKFSLFPKSGAGWGTAVSNSIVFAPGVISIGDWLQVQLLMNFTTGTGTLFYRNLTLAQTAFTPLFWNANLGLNGASSSPSQWNQAWMRIDRPGGTPQLAAFDNLTLAANGPGSENFQGELGTRSFTVWHYTNSPGGENQLMSFPDFVDLAKLTPWGNHFNNAYIPDINNTADFAKIAFDPVLGATNKCLWLHNFAKPGETKGRNELAYNSPYVIDSQPNGTLYTFAFRFHTPALFPGDLILMQGFNEFPWLRILAKPDGRIFLDLAKSTGSVAQYNGWNTWRNANPTAPLPTAYNPVTGKYEDLYGPNNAAEQAAWAAWLASPVGTPPTIIGPHLGWTGGAGEHPLLGNYKVGSWNTVVMQVIHSNDPATGRIEVFVNGNKMATYNGRTTYLVDSAKIQFLKAGPYGTETTVCYDDIYWKPGHVYPYLNEPGLENGGIYSVQSVVAPGKSLNVLGNGTANGTNVQIWDIGTAPNCRFTAQLQTDGSFELIPNNALGQRLDVNAAGVSGANVQIYIDNDTNAQRWKCEYQTDGSGSFELIPQHNQALRLDVKSAGTANGTNVQVYTDNNTAAQRWRLVRLN
ncbi:MAG: RICIN domain-containing protein [Luteolibacter sp.]|nr:RICIN domain-containing protein [Luteolibacter sp.]